MAWKRLLISGEIVNADLTGSAGITGANIAANAIDSDHYTDGSIDNAHIADDAIDSEHYAAGSIDNEHLADDAVDSAEIASGAIDLDHMSANSVDSDQYVDGSIDLAHMSANSVDSDQYVDGSIDLAHMSANSVDSDQYVDGSIDNAHLADNAVDSAELASGAVDHDHLSSDIITGATAETTIADNDLILISDTSNLGALRKMTKANFVSALGGGDVTGITAGDGIRVDNGSTSTPDIHIDFDENTTNLEGTAIATTDVLMYMDSSNSDDMARGLVSDLPFQASGSYAASGANSDITSLSALSTALTVAQGGTGVTTMTALKNALDDETWTFANTVTITGDLDVNGTTTTIDTTNLAVADVEILCASGSTGDPASTFKAGIGIERGARDNTALWWKESTHQWIATYENSSSADNAGWTGVLAGQEIATSGAATSGTADVTGNWFINSNTGKIYVSI